MYCWRTKSMVTSTFLVLFYFLCLWHSINAVRLRFNNMICTSFDNSTIFFKLCRLKLVSRGVVSLNMHAVKLENAPLDNIVADVQLWKKTNGYRPFLYKYKINFCDFVVNRKRFPVLNIFFNIFAEYTNINHTCPYDHDFIVSNLILDSKYYEQFPLPTGEYMVSIKMTLLGVSKTLVKVYLELNEEIA